jgi:uncharacterized repeat protein (TIGR03917 family)
MMLAPIPDPIGGMSPSSRAVKVIRVVHAPVIDHGLMIDPHATVAEVSAALATLPPGAYFTEQFGDVEATLVFREPPAEGEPSPAS